MEFLQGSKSDFCIMGPTKLSACLLHSAGQLQTGFHPLTENLCLSHICLTHDLLWGTECGLSANVGQTEASSALWFPSWVLSSHLDPQALL